MDVTNTETQTTLRSNKRHLYICMYEMQANNNQLVTNAGKTVESLSRSQNDKAR